MKTMKINGKRLCFHGLEELILLKCPYHPKQSTDSMQFHKNPMAFFIKIEKNCPKIHAEPQETIKSQSNLFQEEQSWKHHRL